MTTEESARKLRQLVWDEIEFKLMIKRMNDIGMRMLTDRLLEKINKE